MLFFMLLLGAGVTTFIIVYKLVRWSERRIQKRFEWKTTLIDHQTKEAEERMVTNVKLIHYLYDWEREGWYVSSEKRTGRLDELS